MFIKLFRLLCGVFFITLQSSVLSVQLVQLPEELKVHIASYAHPLAYTTQYFWHCCKIPLQDAQQIVYGILKNISVLMSGKLLKKNVKKRMHFEQRLSCFFTAPVKKFKNFGDSTAFFCHNYFLFFSLSLQVKRAFHPTMKSIIFKNCADALCHYYVVCAYKRDKVFQFSLSLQQNIPPDLFIQLKGLRGKKSPAWYQEFIDGFYEQAALGLELQRVGAFACNIV